MMRILRIAAIAAALAALPVMAAEVRVVEWWLEPVDLPNAENKLRLRFDDRHNLGTTVQLRELRGLDYPELSSTEGADVRFRLASEEFGELECRGSTLLRHGKGVCVVRGSVARR